LGGGVTFFRSLATRGAVGELPDHLDDVVAAVKAAGYDLVVVETPGIGQGDAGIVGRVDVALYVMTPEFGAASQLEKIDMLDSADAVAINKVERRGGGDALRDVGRQLARNRGDFGRPWQDQPVFGTSAARFNDDGVTALYLYLRDLLVAKGLPAGDGTLAAPACGRVSSGADPVVPAARVRYLAEIAETVRGYHADTERLAAAARRREHLDTALAALATVAEVDGTASAASVASLQGLRDEADGSGAVAGHRGPLLGRGAQLRGAGARAAGSAAAPDPVGHVAAARGAAPHPLGRRPGAVPAWRAPAR
jgi:methylmalonyl-CoA mutase